MLGLDLVRKIFHSVRMERLTKKIYSIITDEDRAHFTQFVNSKVVYCKAGGQIVNYSVHP